MVNNHYPIWINDIHHCYIEEFAGGRGGKEKKPIDNTKYYTLLNSTKDSTQDEVKKNFRKIALKEHPDKGGDPEKVRIIYILCYSLEYQFYDDYIILDKLYWC